MPRYELVAHITVELDGSTPEQAAAVFKRELLAQTNGTAMLRGLAVWSPTDGPTPTPLPAPLSHQLANFFAGIGRLAAMEEATFRDKVEEILRASTTPQGLQQG